MIRRFGWLTSSRTMDFLQAFDKAPANGWLSIGEALVLWTFARGEILEVGSYHGRSTTILEKKGHVNAVDPFENFDTGDMSGEKTHSAFLKNTLGMNVTLHKMRVEDFKAIPVDFAFLDGDHTYEGTVNQIQKAIECQAPIIAVHDYVNSGGGVDIVRACTELLGEPLIHIERMGLWRR